MFNHLDKCIFDDFLSVDATSEILWRDFNDVSIVIKNSRRLFTVICHEKTTDFDVEIVSDTFDETFFYFSDVTQMISTFNFSVVFGESIRGFKTSICFISNFLS